MKNLILSIDLDEFYHIRWITGGKNSIYESSLEFFKDIYQTAKSKGDIVNQTHYLLDLLEKFNTKCTFFILGEVADYYPNLVKKIAGKGHEVACHSYRHIDLTLHSAQSFKQELVKAKSLLEDLTGKQIFGFRMPNLVIKNWVKDILLDLGFSYDSSICPSRSLTGKFGDYINYPNIPYRTKVETFAIGNSDFWEFPLPVFPLLKLPGATGNVTRALGKWWTKFTHKRVEINDGTSHYYFHPWEIGTIPDKIKIDTFYKKLFLRRVGNWMKIFIADTLKEYNCISCKKYLELHKTQYSPSAYANESKDKN